MVSLHGTNKILLTEALNLGNPNFHIGEANKIIRQEVVFVESKIPQHVLGSKLAAASMRARAREKTTGTRNATKQAPQAQQTVSENF